MKFIAVKTEDGKRKGKISFCCKMLGVSRQGFYRYLVSRNRPWKYQRLAEIMREICILTLKIIRRWVRHHRFEHTVS